MKKHAPVKIVHLVLMLLLLLFSGAAAVMMIGGFGIRTAGVDRLQLLLRGVFSLFNLAGLLLGVIYLLNEYGKRAAGYYKAFLAMLTVETAFLIVLEFLFHTPGIWFYVTLTLLELKIVVLLLLTFGKDLGKQRSWLLFGVLMALDLAGVALTFVGAGSALLTYRIADALSRLILSGTVGLAIRGKYADKDSRGTK